MKYLTYFTFSLCFFLNACSASQAEAIHNINAAQGKAMMDDEDVIVLDVRTKEEFADGHVPNAKNLPLSEIEKAETLFEKDDKLIVYCRSGARSSQAAQSLSKAGFTDIYDMGGIQDWPYDVVK